ncbi:MAG: insulinase family protein [Clostridia bacterium]|nr:insulinase family protein [Clostridia bacterium]
MAEKSKEKIEKAILINYGQNVDNMTYACFGFICGARLDKKGKEGTGHLVEHSLFNGPFEAKIKDENGVEKVVMLDEKSFYKFLKATGTRMNAYTSNDAIVVELETPNQYFETMVDIIQQMFNIKFDPKRLNEEKKAVLQERLMILDEEGINSLMANRSAKKRSKLIGTPASINNITTQDLEEYARKRFIRDNMVISVVSNLPHKQVKKIVKNLFIDKFPSNAKRKLTLKMPTYPHKGGLKTKDVPYANSFDIQFLFKGLDGVEKNDLMLRFEDWYFNNFAGKLYQELRINKQLVYTSNFLSVPVLNSNLKAFLVKTSPENANRCVEVLSVILRDLIKMV